MELLNVDRPEDRIESSESAEAETGPGPLAVAAVVVAVVVGLAALMLARTDLPPPEPDPTTTTAPASADGAQAAPLIGSDAVMSECISPIRLGLPAGHAAPVIDLAFAGPDRLVSFSATDAVVWAPRSGTTVGGYDLDPAGSIPVVAPDGSVAARVMAATNDIEVLDPISGEVIGEVTGSRDWASGFNPVFTADSASLVTMSGQGGDLVATVHDLVTGGEREVALDGVDVIMGAQSWYTVPAASILAARPRNGPPLAWDLNTGERVSKPVPSGLVWIDRVAAGPDDSIIVPGGTDRRYELYDLMTGEVVSSGATITSIEDMVNDATGRLLAIAGSGASSADPAIEVRDLESDALLGRHDLVTRDQLTRDVMDGGGGEAVVGEMAFSIDGSLLAYTDSTGGLRVLDVTEGLTGLHDDVLVGHSGAPSAITISDDGTRIATVGLREQRQWETSVATPSRSEDARLTEKLSGNRSLEVEEAVRAPVMVEVDGTANVWIGDTQTGEGIRRLRVDGTTVGAAINDDGTVVAVLTVPIAAGDSNAAAVHLLAVEDGELLARFDFRRSELESSAGSADDTGPPVFAPFADIGLSASGRHVAVIEGDVARIFCAVS